MSRSSVDALRSLQDSIARQRTESEALEARIQAQYLAADQFYESGGAAAAAPSPRQFTSFSAAPKPVVSLSSPSQSSTFESFTPQATSALPHMPPAAFNGYHSTAQDSAAGLGHGATVLGSSTRRSVNGDDGAGSVASRSMRSSRASSPSKVVQFRSPRYRSSSPSRRVGSDRVVTSNMGRAPRFRDSKADVPGPGKYEAHDTDFGPARVPSTPDLDGRFGHTWAAWYAAKGLKPSPLAAHENAIAAATARLRPDGSSTVTRGPGALLLGDSASVRSAGPGGQQGPSPAEAAAARQLRNATTLAVMAGNGGGVAASPSSPSSSEQQGDGIEVAAGALIAAAGGNARAALEAALRRERALRREAGAAAKTANAQRLGLTSFQAVSRAEAGEAEGRAKDAMAALEGLSTCLRPLSSLAVRALEAHTGVQRAINELGTSLAAAESTGAGGDPAAALSEGLTAALARFPALGRVVDAARVHDAVLSSLTALVDRALGVAAAGAAGKLKQAAAAAARDPSSPRGRSQSPRPGSEAPPPGGFIGYSSLTAMLAAPTPMGGLGPSDGMLRAMNGDQGAGDTVRRGSRSSSASFHRPVSPSAASARFGRPSAFKGISAADIAGFTAQARASTAAGHAAAAVEAERAAAGVSAAPAAPPSSGQGVGSSNSRRGSSAAPTPTTAAAGAPRPTAPTQQQQAASVRRGSGAPAPPANGRGEPSVAETLSALHAAYGPEGQFGTLQFLRVIRDSGLLDNRFSYADAGALAPGTAGRTQGDALDLPSFIALLSEVACRKFGGRGGAAPSAPDATADAFRALLRLHLLPLHARLLQVGGRQNGPSAPLLPPSNGPGGDYFTGELLSAPVQTFFAEQAGGLAALFAEYATASPAAAAAEAAGAEADRHQGQQQQGFRSWAAARDAGASMRRRGLLAWAADYKVVPDMLPRAALLGLAKEVAAAAGAPSAAKAAAGGVSSPGGTPEEEHPLSLPQFLELLALLAFALGDPRRGDASTLAALGITGYHTRPDGPPQPPLLHKLVALVYHMYACGARFAAGEPTRLLRACAAEVRVLMAEAEAEAAAAGEEGGAHAPAGQQAASSYYYGAGGAGGGNGNGEARFGAADDGAGQFY